ncbi:MAG: extracellular solute-binding protein [Eubacteriales bacterium]|nr:extracellular solute-binding protein [Eubacteriales bacterium]
MKKFLAMMLTIVVATGTLCGCAQSADQLQADPAKEQGNSQEEETTTITIWHDKEAAVAEVLQNRLDALAPKINVVLERKSDLTETLKMVGNDPKAAPDMYFFAHDKIGVYAEMGILTPITDIIPEDELDRYLDQTLEAATYEGAVYQLPIYYETLLFMYNRLYMSDDEVPETTEELYAYMQENTKGGHYGFVEQHSTPYYAAGWINGFGGSILGGDKTPGLDRPETIAALEYHKKFVELMPGESEYATVNTLFKEKMAHSTIAGPWLIPTVRESGMDVGVAPMPVIDQTGQRISPYMGVQGVQVLKHAAETKRDAVEAVLRALMEPDIGAGLAKASGCAPANETCYEMEEVASDEVVMAMKETAEYAVPMPNVPEMDVMWTVAGNLLTDVNMSNKDVAESAQKAQQEAERLIESMQ